MLDKDLLKQVEQSRKAAGVSRNRWIVQALEEYLAHEDAAKAQGGSRLTN
jgi:metal-responsive CopG/Arc/MetJ family transcriptional regulator